MGDVWSGVGGVVNRGGACVLRSGGYLVSGTWFGTCPQMRISVEQEVFYWIFSPFFGFEHIFRNRFCVVVLFIFVFVF